MNPILNFFSTSFKIVSEEFEIKKATIYIDKQIETVYFYIKDKSFKANKEFYNFESKISRKFENQFPNYILIITWDKDPEYLNINFEQETEFLIQYES